MNSGQILVVCENWMATNGGRIEPLVTDNDSDNSMKGNVILNHISN